MADIGALFGLEADLFRLILVGVLGALALGGVAYAVLDSVTAGPTAARRIERGPKARSAGLLGGLLQPDTSPEARRRAIERAGRRQRHGFTVRLEQAGLAIQPVAFILIFALGAIAAGVVAVTFGAPPLWAVGGAAAFAFIAPNFILSQMINSRREAFLAAFPGAIDIMVRGVRAGLPVNESMKVIADEVEGPVGEEVERMIAATNVGFSLEEAAGQLANRIESPDVNFFRTVLVIQKQTGGNLGEALGNLSNIIRERQKLRKKVWALSSEARSSAIIIGSLPILVGAGVYFMKPDYIGMMIDDPSGQFALGCAGVWMLIGIIVMRFMINFKV